MSAPDRGSLSLIAMLAAAVAVVSLAEWYSTRLLGAAKHVDKESHRAGNVVVLREAKALPPPKPSAPIVLMLGNSHMYGVPSLEPGPELLTDEDDILVDEVARLVESGHADRKAAYWLISCPNFLPFEMLTRAGHLVYLGDTPRIAIVGLTWRNIARDSQLRYQYQEFYRDPEFEAALRKMLKEPAVDADPSILDAVQSQLKGLADRTERLKFVSDQLDQRLTESIGRRMTIVDRTGNLRSRIYRVMTEKVQDFLVGHFYQKSDAAFLYSPVETDYRFNRHCLSALIRLLRAREVPVVCYYAPERTDLAPLIDPALQPEFIADFEKEMEQLGVPVLDARGLVPNEYWGYEGDLPDRSHFTKPGHKLLARFLVEETEKREIWKAIERP